jgi:hypothetical protein
MKISDVIEAECANEVIVCHALPNQNHFVDVHFLVKIILAYEL